MLAQIRAPGATDCQGSLSVSAIVFGGARSLASASVSVLAVLVSACSSTPTVQDLLPQAPKFEFRTLPPARNIRALGAPSLIGPDGSCVGPAQQAEFSGGGVALDMSECDVVQRAGPPANIDISTNARGQRSTVLTYLGGERPGIYRFVAGRLSSIERGPEPPAPEPPAKKRAPKKSAGAT
jgi:hypothetical protein